MLDIASHCDVFGFSSERGETAMVTTGTLVVYAFKVVFGNGDVITALASWAIFLTFCFVATAIYQAMR
ncbi:hypothetical protein [Geobacillus sp. ZGt-1]|uniref:hypothetical protein n=1 Tax=Geobacillus sp. ZGt-1 TaxID=1631556 RepID=UPI001F36158C|nr:hypothetical protein [Geobacillus sp. ZGt-1]